MRSFPARIFRGLRLLVWLIYVGAKSVPIRYQKDRWKAIHEMSGMIKLWGAGIVSILGVEIKVVGDLSSVKGCLVVSNHLGVLDIFVHAAVFGFRFAPKSDIRSWPLLGWYTDLTLPVWVDRNAKSGSQATLEEFRETMRNGVPLIVYPEGTSSDGRSGVLPFKSTPFEAAVKGEFPVRPVLTSYEVSEDADETPCWYGDMTLLPHLWTLLGFKKLVAKIRILPEAKPEGRDRKALAQEIHGTLQAEYERAEKRRVSKAERPGGVELEGPAL